MRTAIFVQARMGSTRLPGKPLLKVLGRPLLSYLIERLKFSQKADLIAVLTTTQSRDDLIQSLTEAHAALCFRGSEEDVLSRFAEAARFFSPDQIVRITADCPLIDSALIDQMLQVYEGQACPCLSNTVERSFARGMDIEIFTREALLQADLEATLPEEREHVTLYFYRHPERFKIASYSGPHNHSHWRWTVDTPEDFVVVARLLAAHYPHSPQFTYQDLVQWVSDHPKCMDLNRHIQQKDSTSR